MNDQYTVRSKTPHHLYFEIAWANARESICSEKNLWGLIFHLRSSAYRLNFTHSVSDTCAIVVHLSLSYLHVGISHIRDHYVRQRRYVMPCVCPFFSVCLSICFFLQFLLFTVDEIFFGHSYSLLLLTQSTRSDICSKTARIVRVQGGPNTSHKYASIMYVWQPFSTVWKAAEQKPSCEPSEWSDA